MFGAADGRNPNDSQELRLGKPRKAYKSKGSLSAANTENRAQTASSFLLCIGRYRGHRAGEAPDTEQRLTARQVKALANKIAARCLSLKVTLGEKNMDALRTALAEAPILTPPFASAAVRSSTPEQSRQRRLRLSQANTTDTRDDSARSGGGRHRTETAVDRYYAHKDLRPQWPGSAPRCSEKPQRGTQHSSASIAAVMEEEAATDAEFAAWMREHPTPI